MPEERVDLEEGLADSPQVRAQVGKIERGLGPYKEFTTLLRDTFQACSVHQEKVCEGTETLSKLLVSYQDEATGDSDKLISGAFFRLSRYLNELHSCQEMLSTQLQNAVIELLSQVISSDFGKLEKLKENQEIASMEHEQATIKYSRASKKKDSEKSKFELNSELFMARKKFCDTSLDYYSELNCFQHKKKFALLEPLLTYMHAQMAYFKVGHEILNKELGKLLTNLNSDVQRVHGDYQKEVMLSTESQAELRLRFPVLCLPDPDPSDPFLEQPILPNTSLTTKAGYLFIRTQTGFPSKWDRAYFFTKKGYLYIHMMPKPPELVVHLKGAEATSAEMDDRRYVFVVSHSSLKRPLYLLAESDNQKEEWICTINNIGQDRGNAQPRSNAKRDEAIIKMEREKIRSWVNKEIDPKKASPLSKLSKPSAPVTTATISPASSSTSITTSTFSAQLHSLSSLSSLPSFLNFLDPTASQQQQQPEEQPSGTAPQKKSPLFSRKSSAVQKAADGVKEDVGGANVGPLISPQPPNLPSPLQPEQLTVGVSPSSRLPQNTYSRTFFVKYLGHVEVQEGRNVTVIIETIQRVVTARAMKNRREAQSIEMTVTHKSINLFDQQAKKAIGQIFLRDILRCAVQPDSSKLFGIVNRVTGENTEAGKHKFLCHVMEAETTGSKVCAAINDAIKAAVKMMNAGRQHTRARSSHEQTRSLRSKDYVSSGSSSAPTWPATSPQSSVGPPPRPARPPIPKQKSISDSNLRMVGNSRQSSSQSSPARLSKQQPTRNGGPITSAVPDAPQNPPSTVSPSPSFSTMPSLMEQTTLASPTSNNKADLPMYPFTSYASTNGSSQPHTTSYLGTVTPSLWDAPSMSSGGGSSIVSAATAPDSGYFQMPSSLHGSTNELSDVTSPLTPLDSDIGSFSSIDPSMLGISEKDSDTNPPLASSSSVSDYLEAPDGSSSAWPPSTGSEASEFPNSMFGGGESEVPSPFGSTPSYLPSGTSCVNSEPEGDKPLTMQVEDIFDTDNFSSSADTAATLFTSSSSQSFMNTASSYFQAAPDNQTLTYSQSNTVSSDYLPSDNTNPMQSGPPDFIEHGQAWDTSNGFSTAAPLSNGQTTEPATSATSNGNSTQITFPVSFSDDNDGGDFDDFDLPPLPDTLNVPNTSSMPNYSFGGGGGQSGQGSYAGSIVTLGNSTSNN